MKTTTIEPSRRNEQGAQPLSEQGLPMRSGEAQGSRAPCQIQDILVPIDFSEQSINALAYAMSFAEQHGAKITLLHVIEPPIAYQDMSYGPAWCDQLVHCAEKTMFRVCEQQKVNQTLIKQTKVEPGVAYVRIIEAAKAQKTDLIILATHGRTGLAHFLLGSTAEKVVRLAPCPVLVVRSRSGGAARNN